MTIEEDTDMSVQIVLDDQLVQGRNPAELTKHVREAVLLYDYVIAQISLGEFAEGMGLSIIDARDWLHRMGIPTSRIIRDPDLALAVEQDRQVFEESLHRP